MDPRYQSWPGTQQEGDVFQPVKDCHKKLLFWGKQQLQAEFPFQGIASKVSSSYCHHTTVLKTELRPEQTCPFLSNYDRNRLLESPSSLRVT